MNDAHPHRLPWLDGLHGLIMVLMAVDHANFFIARVHPEEFWGVPLPVYGEAISFLTRFVTHLCAPGFFFLMGVSLALFAEARPGTGWSEWKIARFLALRGFILILLQLFIENPAWALSSVGRIPEATVPPGAHGDIIMLNFGVLYGLGATMIFWSLWRRVPTALIATVSVISILVVPLLMPGAERASIQFSPWLRLLMIPGQTGICQVLYPLLPWLGVTGLGLVFGRLVRQKEDRSHRIAMTAGAIFIFGFILLRVFSSFGDYHVPGDGWIGFLNLAKYPPSIEFILLMLGVDLLLLFLFATSPILLKRWAMPLLAFGSTPLFFYIAHLYLFGLAGAAFPQGASSGVMYLVWILILALLYPLCLWYRRFKERRAPDSIWRFF
jgi:uncharacterized membrane protein